jgi:hypothetical protein
MPRGGRRRGAGRPGKPVSHYLHRGTYRADRHGPLPGNVVPMPMPAPGAWIPTDDDLASVGPAGREFIARMRESYVFSVAEVCW